MIKNVIYFLFINVIIVLPAWAMLYEEEGGTADYDSGQESAYVLEQLLGQPDILERAKNDLTQKKKIQISVAPELLVDSLCRTIHLGGDMLTDEAKKEAFIDALKHMPKKEYASFTIDALHAINSPDGVARTAATQKVVGNLCSFLLKHQQYAKKVRRLGYVCGTIGCMLVTIATPLFVWWYDTHC